MRLFEMDSGVQNPIHSHNGEHKIFILEGKGLVIGGQEEKKLKAGDAIFIHPNEKRQLKSSSKKACRFLCFIPYKEK